jgi:hypothetical protein
MRSAPFVVAILVIAGASCTRGTMTTTTPPPPAPSGSLPTTVAVGGVTYDISCSPVAEALVDVELPRPPGAPRVRAITGLWDHQAIAVLANDAQGCGVWALGLAEGLSPEATAAITGEVERGLQDFGVTASPVPREP